MEKNLTKYTKDLNYLFISFLFSSFIFFWDISFNFLQLRFLIFLLIIPILFKLDKILIKKTIKYFLVPFLIFLHTIIQSPDISLNIFLEVLGFFFLCIIFKEYKNHFFEKLDQVIYIFILFLFLYIIFSFFSWDEYLVQVSSTCIGCFSILREFFNENSHFGIAIVPVIFYLLFLSKTETPIKLILLSLIFILSYLNLSITLVAGLIVLIASIPFMFWKNKKSLILFLIFIFFIIISSKNFLNNKNKISDILLKPKQINLSSEVYLASMFVAKKALLNKPFGYGFNNYNIAFDEFINEFDPFNKHVLVLNRKDASNNLSKIITEFGVFSIFYFYFLISFFLKKNVSNKIKLFLLIPLIIQTFFRGAGYFNGGFLLFLVFSFLLWKEKSYIDYEIK